MSYGGPSQTSDGQHAEIIIEGINDGYFPEKSESDVYVCASSKDRRWPENVINEINKFKEKMNVLGIETIVYSVPPLVEN